VSGSVVPKLKEKQADYLPPRPNRTSLSCGSFIPFRGQSIIFFVGTTSGSMTFLSSCPFMLWTVFPGSLLRFTARVEFVFFVSTTAWVDVELILPSGRVARLTRHTVSVRLFSTWPTNAFAQWPASSMMMIAVSCYFYFYTRSQSALSRSLWQVVRSRTRVFNSHLSHSVLAITRASSRCDTRYHARHAFERQPSFDLVPAKET
jgi:hypothetical protein